MQLHAAKTKKQHSTIQKSTHGRKSTHGTNYYEEYHIKYCVVQITTGKEIFDRKKNKKIQVRVTEGLTTLGPSPVTQLGPSPVGPIPRDPLRPISCDLVGHSLLLNSDTVTRFSMSIQT